jgi:hypothetical protein
MQKLKLQNKWDNQAKKFTEEFDFKETEKTITGKISVSSKQNDKYVSKSIPFILFKSQTTPETQSAVKSGKFEASFGIGVNQFQDSEGKTITYHQLIINEAKSEGISKHSVDKGNAYQPQDDDFFVDDTVPY